MLGSREPAMDVAQDTFLKMMNRLNHREKPIENPRAWLYKVAGNLCLNEISKKRHHQVLDHEIERIQSNKDDPEKTMINQEKRSLVKRAVENLKPEQQLLIMMYQDGLTYREMAEATGIKEQSVGKTLWRVIHKISETIKKINNDE